MNDIAYLLPFAPLFLVLLVLENWFSKKQEARPAYAFGDTFSNLSCAVGQNAAGLLTTAMLFRLYNWAYENFAITHWEGRSWVAWLLAFLLGDFFSYWYHWFSHRVRLFWVFHSVHHQSERLNFSATVRESWFGNFMQVPFYASLPLLGVPLNLFLVSAAFIGIYQIWLHTNLIGNLGWYEKFMNTPSLHRVHHSRRAHELDKNLASSLMIWDHLFGTYQKEESRPRYGTVEPFRSYNPAWAQWVTLSKMLRLLKRTHGFKNYVRVIFGSPEWTPRDVPGQAPVPEAEAAPEIRFEIAVPPLLKAYVTFQFSVCIVVTVFLLMKYKLFGSGETIVAVLWVLASLGIVGGLLEKRRWARGLEIARNLFLFAYLAHHG